MTCFPVVIIESLHSHGNIKTHAESWEDNKLKGEQETKKGFQEGGRGCLAKAAGIDFGDMGVRACDLPEATGVT